MPFVSIPFRVQHTSCSHIPLSLFRDEPGCSVGSLTRKSYASCGSFLYCSFPSFPHTTHSRCASEFLALQSSSEHPLHHSTSSRGLWLHVPSSFRPEVWLGKPKQGWAEFERNPQSQLRCSRRKVSLTCLLCACNASRQQHLQDDVQKFLAIRRGHGHLVDDDPTQVLVPRIQDVDICVFQAKRPSTSNADVSPCMNGCSFHRMSHSILEGYTQKFITMLPP